MKNDARDAKIYRDIALGRTIQNVAFEHGLSESRIYAIVQGIRGRQKPVEVTELRDDLTLQLNELRFATHELATSNLLGPDERVRAVQAIVSITGRIAKMYGLDTVRVENVGQVTYTIEGVDVDEV